MVFFFFFVGSVKDSWITVNDCCLGFYFDVWCCARIVSNFHQICFGQVLRGMISIRTSNQRDSYNMDSLGDLILCFQDEKDELCHHPVALEGYH